MAPVKVNKVPVDFIFDSGAAVTMINHDSWEKIGRPPLENNNKIVEGIDGSICSIRGPGYATFKIGDTERKGTFFVIDKAVNNLLGIGMLESFVVHVEFRRKLMMSLGRDQVKGEEKKAKRNKKGVGGKNTNKISIMSPIFSASMSGGRRHRPGWRQLPILHGISRGSWRR